jgi:serine/threonine protein kinase
MVMNNLRVPLRNGTTLAIGGSEYRITYIDGKIKSDKGASCLVYDAVREPSAFEKSIGMPPVPAVIKEFYPHDIAESISRNCDTINVSLECYKDFNKLRNTFERGAVRQVEFYGNGSNHSFAPSRIDCVNGTVYTVVDSAQGKTLDEVDCLEIDDFGEVMISLREAVQELHNEGILHLDIKPSNIFLFDNNGELSRRVALFDFDTVMSIDEIERGCGIIPYSQGFAPYEQIRQIRKGAERISYATDVYALGAVMYWFLTDSIISSKVLTQIKMNDFSFLDNNIVLNRELPAKEQIIRELGATLKRFPTQREAQTIEELMNL